jgi:thiol:disulfide interchange protein DsbD
MKFLMSFVVLLGLCTAAGTPARAQTPRNLVKAQLKSDLRPGTQSFLVGVHLQIESGWHIYWKYPGDAGLATSVKWELPDGFAVSDLLWPTPIGFEQAGQIQGFGYEEEVVLLAQVTPPPGWAASAMIGAEVRWLACETTCVPGKASLQLQVDPAVASDPADRELLAQWLAHVPIPADAPENPAKIKVTTSGLDYRIELSGIGAEHVQCLLAPADGLSVVSNEVEGLKVHIVLHAMEGPKPSKQPSEAVIAWTEAGKPHAVSVQLGRQ